MSSNQSSKKHPQWMMPLTNPDKKSDPSFGGAALGPALYSANHERKKAWGEYVANGGVGRAQQHRQDMQSPLVQASGKEAWNADPASGTTK
ncbi:hypothetical protein AFCA_004356 [Aspergillus flavus]|uniref:Uncharacterized protein n=1 Tax=Aspergillus flavus TaxID=5059 RepID=A0AB74BVV7_ASPFL|nr:hypothetical protein CA14_011580 [Aspergillus flavus]UDD56834.1 hypothetical protein AFCA_004356 [Aspergillus flavus]